ncbi:hypothetical protein AAC03nite_39460 [Alicyclobacillus acidoterrestris]|nr:hypothetical protein AAC03nite_39460 [Alicyclobacillus acidoterrestris]
MEYSSITVERMNILDSERKSGGILLTKDDEKEIINILQSLLPIDTYGYINWELIQDKVSVDEPNAIMPVLRERLNKVYARVYVIWANSKDDDFGFNASLLKTIHNVEKLVDSDMYIICAKMGYVIHLHPNDDGQIIINITFTDPGKWDSFRRKFEED